MSHLYKKHHLKKSHSRRQRQLVDKLTLGAAIMGPLFTIPQVIKAYAPGDGGGISLTTWVAYDALSIIWIYYGIIHKERLIVVAQTLYLCAQTAVVIGAIQHGARW